MNLLTTKLLKRKSIVLVSVAQFFKHSIVCILTEHQ